ncbi:MAG: hypothetical protein ACLPSW_30465 [Roseiarcus sp.]
MVDVLEFRIGKLARISDHYRKLGAALAPETVSAEIAAVADAFDNEVTRISRECVGRRACPCEFAHSCIAVVGDRPGFEPTNTKKAA